MSPILRCSELDRVLSCPGSLTLNAIVKHRVGDEGTEGTALHYIAHRRMIDELSAVGDAGATPEIPSSVAFSGWISDYYFAYVRDNTPADWSLEIECALAFEWPRFTLSGHIDSVAINPDATEAIGFDLKTGYDPVDIAEQNEQVLGYAVLLLRAYPTLCKIAFHIIQPRNDEDEGFQRVSSVTLEGDTLAGAPDSLAARISAALDNSMEVSTGLKCCKWCSAAPQCPAQISLREHMKATLTKELLEKIKATPDDATLGDWVISGRVLNRPLQDAEALLDERIAANGYVVAGDGTQISVKEQAGSYTFPDPGAFYRATRAVIADDDKYASTVKPSVTRLKEVIAEVRGIPKTSKKGESAQSVFDTDFRPLVVQGVRKIKVFQ